MSYFFTSYIACDISVVTKEFYGESFRLSISLTSYSLFSFSSIGFNGGSSPSFVDISTLLSSSQSEISKFASFFFLDSKTCLNYSILGLRTCSESIIDMTGYQGSSCSWSGCSYCALRTPFSLLLPNCSCKSCSRSSLD